ncbi:MAG: ATP phosphoribosyltransferase [Armatimonadetes bacterium]|nr:ATP phosphoribosyltransferase [Armatimonadota bacterium]MDW8121872.1 ATP phosphoribosyltransferase [Armatimonadota bacterium]
MALQLRFGIPKGSLQESTLRLFRLAGWEIQVEGRSHFPRVNDPDLQPILLRAQEIPRYVAEGVLDAGLTGWDQVLENEAQDRVVLVSELVYSKQGLGQVRLVIAVHEQSPIQNVKDLNGKRIATELPNVVKKFLRERGVEATVEFSWGSTEAKVPDLVDAIADVTETGATLRAANLRIVETILESTTRLIANPVAWANEAKRQKIQDIALLLEGALRAQQKVGLKLNVQRKDLEKVLSVLPAMKAPTISPLADEDWVAIEVIVDEVSVRSLIPLLKGAGAQDIIEYPLNKVIP